MFLKAYIYFGPYDFIFLGLVTLINTLIWKKNINNSIGCIIAIGFFFIFPLISMMVEIQRKTTEDGMAMDAFELLYAYLRFPIYWVMGVLQLTLFGLKKWKLNKQNIQKSNINT